MVFVTKEIFCTGLHRLLSATMQLKPGQGKLIEKLSSVSINQTNIAHYCTELPKCSETKFTMEFMVVCQKSKNIRVREVRNVCRKERAQTTRSIFVDIPPTICPRLYIRIIFSQVQGVDLHPLIYCHMLSTNKYYGQEYIELYSGLRIHYFMIIQCVIMLYPLYDSFLILMI